MIVLKTLKNYTLNHFIERIKIYNEENFNYEIITIQLKNMIEDDFYGTIKFKNGEEIFAKVAPASDEEDRTMLIVHTPVMVSEVKAKGGIVGYKVEPWLKTSREDMFIINMDNVLTLSESSDMEMIICIKIFRRFIKKILKIIQN